MEPKILLLGVISVCSVGVGTVTVIQDPPFLNLSAGDTARVSCVVKNVTVGVTLNHSWNLHGSWENLANSSRMTVTPNSLTISSLTPNDSGLYTCMVRDNYLLPYRGNGTYLSVTEVPDDVSTVIKNHPFLNSSVGDTARLSCDVSDVKADFSYWYRHINGHRRPLENSPRVTVTPNSLTIFSVTPNDSGLYICSVRDKNFHVTSRNGILLSVTATFVLSLMVDTRNHLLICKAERFYPPELYISWSKFPRGDQVRENMTESEDGTFTKISIVSITEDLQGHGISCTVHHVTLSRTLYLHDPGFSLYQQLLPVRVLLIIQLILSLVLFQIYHHLQGRCSDENRNRKTTRGDVEISEAVVPSPGLHTFSDD